MKKAFFIFSILCFSLNSSAQKLHLTISGKSKSENTLIDSVGYNKNHVNAKSIVDEMNLMSNTLTQIGYIENEFLDYKKINDSSFTSQFDLGVKTEYIYISRNATLNSLFNTNKDTLIIPYKRIELFLKQTLSTLEKKGFALAKLKLTNFKKNDNHLYADLQVILGQQRQLDGIVIRGYDKFPEGHILNIRRIYKNQTFNQDNLKKVHADFEKFRFVKQVKYPEILFEKDSTIIYVYLEKTKSNNFEGFIGFSNDKGNKIALNGFLDLNLNNTLNSGEAFSLLWKGESNQQRTLNVALAIPYIFKSPFGIKTQLNIFKQDSTFQNAKKAIDVGYFFNYNTRIYLGYQSTESSDIQNQNNNSISDYSNQFITSNFEFADYKEDDLLFPEKTKINIAVGTGSRNSKFNTTHQFFTNIDLKHNLYLNEKNSINIKSQNFYLQSNEYITNELYRFGGINSIRGYSENSLQCNLLTSILTEYRYIFTPTLYIHSITDYGYYQDKSTNNNGNLLGLGIGFGVLTKNGLLNIIYANGSTKEGGIKNSNSIVHIRFKTNF
ncbi:outer membrane protein assembly factor [Flavobacterium psychrotolerans]|uniref:outer membrane protein assembly factor n=1 Tax=Flavobacterium psychrotolerans TaxID=2169410 RepID=UPI001FB58D5C|nr:outer membrane protein assembly factor [Flavobacterium psychrotolerans]